MAAEQGWVDGHLQMGTMYYRKLNKIMQFAQRTALC